MTSFHPMKQVLQVIRAVGRIMPAVGGGRGRQVFVTVKLFLANVSSHSYLPSHLTFSLQSADKHVGRSHEEGRAAFAKVQVSYNGCEQIAEKIWEGKAPRVNSLVSAHAVMLLRLWEGKVTLEKNLDCFGQH